MIKRIRHRGLRLLYERGDRSGVPPSAVKRLLVALSDLDDASKPSDMDLPGYRVHPLKGRWQTYWSIRVTGNWRLTFRFEEGHVTDVDFVDYH